jgi:putative intracellular protease/amidase
MASTGRRRTIALILSGMVHATALLLAVVLLRPAEPPERPPIEVQLLEPEPPPEEPPDEPPVPQLRFRRTRYAATQETIAIPPRTQALAPPPPDVELDLDAMGGVLAIEEVGPSPLGGFTPGGAGGGRAGVGFGRGNARDGTGDFERFIGGLREVGLDVVFVIDATGSMGWLVDQVKDRVQGLSGWLRRLVPVTRFGVVAYRDVDGPGFVTKVLPLTLSARRVRRFLEELETEGGGDIPEAVEAGLAAAIDEAGFRPDAKRVIIVLGDAPPHDDRLPTALALARDFHAAGGTVTTVDTSFDANPQVAAARLGKRVEDLQTLDPRGVLPSFVAIAREGGGDASNLEAEGRLQDLLAVLIFGKRWAEDVRPLLGEL